MKKYRNKPVTVDGIKFDSTKEAKRYGELKLLERAGEIAELERQPKFVLTTNGEPIQYVGKGRKGKQVTYTADFRYYDIRRQKWIIEDAKGVETPVFKLKRAIMASMGLDVEVV